MSDFLERVVRRGIGVPVAPVRAQLAPDVEQFALPMESPEVGGPGAPSVKAVGTEPLGGMSPSPSPGPGPLVGERRVQEVLVPRVAGPLEDGTSPVPLAATFPVSVVRPAGRQVAEGDGLRPTALPSQVQELESSLGSAPRSSEGSAPRSSLGAAPRSSQGSASPTPQIPQDPLVRAPIAQTQTLEAKHPDGKGTEVPRPQPLQDTEPSISIPAEVKVTRAPSPSPSPGPSPSPSLGPTPAPNPAPNPAPAPSPQAAPPSPQPDIRVTIGRVEVQAVSPPAPFQPTGPARERTAFGEYRLQRSYLIRGRG